MGDAFRGLTIRLGADVRPLTSALGSVRDAAGKTQREFNRLTKALKFNPSDAKVMASRISLMDDKMRLTARSTQLMKTALKQASAETKRMASQSRGMTANAQKTRDEYNGVNRQLEDLYDSMARVKAASDNIKFDKAREQVRALAKQLDSLDVKTRTTARNTIRGYLTKLSASNNLPLGITGTEVTGANNALSALTRLRTAQKQLNSELEKLKEVEAYKKTQFQIAAAKAELMEAATQAARFKSELYAAGSGNTAINKTTQELKQMDSILSTTRQKVEQMDDAYRAMPKSLDAAIAKERAMRQHFATIGETVETLKARMKAIEEVHGFDKQAAAAKNVYASVSKLETEYANLEVQLKEDAAAADLLEQEMRNLVRVNGESAKGTNTYKKLESELEEYRSKVRKLRTDIIATDNALENANMEKEWVEARDAVIRYEAEIAKAQAKHNKLNIIGNVGASIKNMGYAAYSTITPTIMMVGRYAIQSADDVDAAYRDMRKTVQGTEEDFEHLKDAAIDYGRTHVTSADKILEIEAIGGQLGITVDKLEGFATTVSNLDIATNMDTETIAADLGKMGSVMNLTTKEYDNFADSLVRLGNSEPAFESDIMTITTRFMGMGKVVGMNSHEMLAWATAATATGQKAEAAGSSMQRFISKMETAVVGGGEDLDKYAKAANMASKEFAALFKQDASGAMYKFIEGLGEIQKSGGSVNQTLAELGINNVRDKQLLEGFAQQMANATDENNVLRDSLLMSENAWNGVSDKWGDAGDAAREAEKKSQGFSGQLQIMKNNAQALAVELGDGAAPIIANLNTLITSLTGALKNMPDGAKTAVVAMMGIAAAVGPTSVAIGSFMTSFSNIGNTLKSMPTLWHKVSRGMTDSALSMGYAFGQTEKNMKGMNNSVKNAAKGISSSANKIKGAASNISSGMSGGLKGSLITIAVMAAIAGITMIVDGYAKLQERQARFAESAKKTSNLFENMGKAAQESSENVDNLGFALKETASAADEAAQSNIDMADKLSENLIRVATDSANLDRVTDKIINIGKAAERTGGLTHTQLNDLRTAVVEFNEINGTNYVVDETGKIRDEEGALVDLTKAFKEAADAKKMMWKADALDEAAKEAQNTSSESYSKLQKAKAGLEQLKRMQANPEAYGIKAESMKSLDEQIAATEKNVKELEGAYQQADTAAHNALGAGDVFRNAAQDTKSIDAVLVRFDKFAEACEVNGVSAEDLRDSIASLGLGYEDIKGLSDEAVQSIEEGWTGGMDTLGQLLEKNGIKLNKAQQEMINLATASEVSGSQLSAIYQQAGGDIATVRTQLELINELKMNDKQFTINDDGTISTTDAELRNLDYLKIGNKVFEIDSKGTIKETTKDVKDLKGIVGTLNGKTIAVNADTSQARQALAELLTRLAIASAKTFTIDVLSKIHPTTGATGTFTDFPIRAAVPAHAAGGITGIVTQPTMTNWGLVGEAGAEALVRWAHGTAVVPLENHRYVRPFAQTIAQEMGSSYQQPMNVTNVYLNDVLINSHPEMQRATEDYLNTLARYTSMGGK